MKHSLDTYATALSALGHDARLCIFRILVRAGAEGLTVGDIVVETDLPPSTLAHHLKTLVASGLVVQEREGREIISRVNYEAMKKTIEFLTSECCTGVKLVKEKAA